MRDLEDPGFVGRVEELAGFAEAITSSERLITIIGPPGVGKSRLARHAAGAAAMVVDLADLTDDGELDRRVADRLGWTSGRPEAGMQGTVIVDNVDRIVDVTATRVIDWLQRAPSLIVVVTSRQRLRAPGELVLEVPPLGLPPADEREVTGVLASEAARLFVACAPGLVVRADDARTIADLLHRLDGLPLAIQLAASRLSVLDLGQLAQRMDRRFDLLSTSARCTPIHHASMWSAIEWSWSLLSPVEQAGLAQCSAFRRSFPLVAAEAVLALGPGAQSVIDILDTLAARSLVQVVRTPGREPRFCLYDSVRDFASGQLARSSTEAEVLVRHRRYFELSRWIATQIARPPGPETEGVQARLVLDLEDLAAAFERGLQDPARVAEIVSRRQPTFVNVERLLSRQARLGPFWLLRRTVREAVELAIGQTDEAGARSAVFRFLGSLAATVGRSALAQRMFDRAFVEAERSERPGARGRSLFAFGASAAAGDSEARRAILGEALAVARELGDRDLEACTLAQLGATYFDDAMAEEAITHWDTAVEHLGRLGWDHEQALVLASRGIAHQEQLRFAAARRDLEAARAIHHERGDPRLAAGVDGYLAILDHEASDLDTAAVRYHRAIDALSSLGARGMEALYLAFLGGLEAERGALAKARTAFAAAEQATRFYGNPAGRQIVATLHGILDVADARDAHERGEADLARTLRTRATVGAAEHPHPPSELRVALRLLRRALADRALVVATNGSWFRISNGRQISLARRPVLRNLVVALARGLPLSTADLIEAGWPDESISPTAAVNRLHVALTALRNLGLRSSLTREGDAYRLGPSVTIADS